ncbi:L,D-transpeptidase-like protein [Methylobacter tundripaludum]|uniref:L,D-transpeptidase-like protein n=1 Tax=Methylobacter tundripaludum TaxID=173365 RepID=A0A2S6H3H8_9GAMM|nr:L,D-transpeptidase [Methylobacter tundripaludum]PPK72052.1 L,D-transpeptidase-like protein [Methylobacter tundripaludum]
MKKNGVGDTENYLDICIAGQQLTVYADGNRVVHYPVSTAKKGAGELMGSECTPTGWHKIRAKIGAGQPLNSVFVGRRPTGEIYSADLGEQHPQRDWMLTRILWLGGLEPGKNRYGNVDTAWRYIYIHGCPDHLINGRPESHGCIRMNNADVLDLFNRVEAGVKVYIHE